MPFFLPQTLAKLLFHISCVARDSCDFGNDIVEKRGNQFDLDGFTKSLGEAAECLDENMVCCHENNKKDENNSCSSHNSIGFR